MLALKEKLDFLQNQLEADEKNYSNTFKSDIQILLGDFNVTNPNFKFLKNLKSKEDISNWITKLTSRIVLKFDCASESLNDFIYDYIELG